MALYQRNQRALHADVGGELIVMNSETMVYFSLNEVGGTIWDFLGNGPVAEADILENLLDQYDVEPARCGQAVQAFLAHAEAQGLVDLR